MKSLVEIMLLIVIIGLLAAMAVPAFVKVRENTLVKAYEQGEKLDKQQMAIVREYYKKKKEVNALREHREKNSEVEEYKTIIIDGKTYKLIPQ